jgi:P2-related tail formation protein
MGEYSDALYEELAPIAKGDEERGYPLRTFVEGLGEAHEPIRELTLDQTGADPLSALYDPDRCPASALGWLAQHVGVQLPVGISDDAKRELIKDPAGMRRCKRSAVISAVQATLTGTKYVNFIDRNDGSFWKWLIVTRTAETPAPEQTVLAALSQKTVGVVLEHVVTDVTLIDELVGTINDQTGDINDL